MYPDWHGDVSCPVSGQLSWPDVSCLLFCVCKLFAHHSFTGARERVATPCFIAALGGRMLVAPGVRHSFSLQYVGRSTASLPPMKQGLARYCEQPLHPANQTVRCLRFASSKATSFCLLSVLCCSFLTKTTEVPTGNCRRTDTLIRQRTRFW